MKNFVRLLALATLLIAGPALAVTPVPCTGAGNPTENPLDLVGGYFIANDTNPSTQVYSASQAIMVADTDAGFATWQAQAGNCVYTYPTLASIYAAENAQATANSPTLPVYFSTSSAANVTLTNPLGIAVITMTTASKAVILPNMGLSTSPPIGRTFRIVNAGLTNSFDVLDSGSNTVISGLAPQTYVDITTTAFGGPYKSATWAFAAAYGAGGAQQGLPIAAPVVIGGTGQTSLCAGGTISGGNSATAPLQCNQGTIGQLWAANGGTSPPGWITAGTNGQMLFGVNSSWPQFATVSGDCTTTNAGVFTCTKTNGTAFTPGATNSVVAEQARLSTSILVTCVTGVNFNAVGDTSLPFVLPTGKTRMIPFRVQITNATNSLTTAVFGLFSQPLGAGNNMVSSGAITLSATTDAAANNAQTTSTISTTSYVASAMTTPSTAFFRVTTPEGVAATADVCFEYWARP